MQYISLSKYRISINPAFTSLAAVLLSAAMTITAFAQHPGDLDTAFGNVGKVIDGISHGDEYGNAMAIQSDGKIVVAGQANGDFALVRYNLDGSLDSTFGSGGKVTTSFGYDDKAYSLTIQSDGKIVAAGSGYFFMDGRYRSVFALLRCNSDGSLDTSFGVGGKVTTAMGSVTSARAIALQADGKIVAAGESSNNYGYGGFALARYNPNGTLDTSFGSGGIVTTDFGYPPPALAGANAVAIESDGKIVAAGYHDSYAFALVRYNSNGSLDQTFGSLGRLVAPGSAAKAVLVQLDGKILAASNTHLFRFNPNGSPDTSFGDGGIAQTLAGPTSIALQVNGKIVAAGYGLARHNPDGSPDGSFGSGGSVSLLIDAAAIAIQADGKIVAAGSTHAPPSNVGYDFALARYSPGGSPDPTFDTDGNVATDFGVFTENSLSAVAIRTDGKIVVAGSARESLVIARYAANGAPDTTFGSGGKVETKIVPWHAVYYSISLAIQPDGKMVIGSHVYSYDGNYEYDDNVLVRYKPDGSLDTTFDGDGIVYMPITGVAVAIQSDGKLVSAGDRNYDMALARINPDGSADMTFGIDGIAAADFGGIDFARSVSIQPDGKIVAVGGSGGKEGGSFDFAAARYNTDGSLDSSFDVDGRVRTAVGEGDDLANSFAFQADGKIVAAGTSRNSSTTHFALVRYNSNGSLDTSFDSDGKVITPIDSGEPRSVAVQRDGKIVIGGSSSNGANDDFTLARYNPNGSLDTTFSGDGISTVDFNNSSDFVGGSALDRHGRAVVVGGSDGAFALARFLLESRRSPFDFDGDGRSDLSVFRPSDSVWYLNRSTQGFSAIQFGFPTDKLVPADYDGDRQTDIAVYRDGVWWILKSGTGTVETRSFGLASDVPVPADYSGDGRDELAVYRNGQWWSFDLASEQVSLTNFGLPADRPVPADFDGDGRVDQAVYRAGVWHLNRSSLGYTTVSFGLPNDGPVVGDYDGDGNADVAVYRDGTWYMLESSAGWVEVQWGLSTDVPSAADYDGDGKTDNAVYRDGTWYVKQSTGGVMVRQFGVAGDRPVPTTYVP